MGWKQYKSTASIYLCIANQFKNRLKNKALVKLVLKEIKEMKLGGTFRTIELVGMRFFVKMKRCQVLLNGAECKELELKKNPMD